MIFWVVKERVFQSTRFKEKKVNRWLYMLLMSGFVLFGFACSSVFSSSSVEIAGDETETIIMCDPQALSNLLVDVSERSISSVVTVKVTCTIEETLPFCLPMSAGSERGGIGSGVIIQEGGYIVTNCHILRNAEEFIITLATGEDVPAVLVGSDPESDIALLRIDTDIPIQSIQPIELGNSDDLRVGEMVLSIGSPFGLSQTVSLGIISHLERSCTGYSYSEKLIQTDAEINPGNSGGALVNLDGKLVGVSTALASQNGEYQGIGFAIPVNTVVHVVNELIQSGFVSRNWLGACLQEASFEFSGETALIESGAVVLVGILPGSPAELAGLKKNDIVIAINGQRFESVTEFRNRIASLDPEVEVSLTIVRNGIEQLVSVQL